MPELRTLNTQLVYHGIVQVTFEVPGNPALAAAGTGSGMVLIVDHAYPIGFADSCCRMAESKQLFWMLSSNSNVDELFRILALFGTPLARLS